MVLPTVLKYLMDPFCCLYFQLSWKWEFCSYRTSDVNNPHPSVSAIFWYSSRAFPAFPQKNLKEYTRTPGNPFKLFITRINCPKLYSNKYGQNVYLSSKFIFDVLFIQATTPCFWAFPQVVEQTPTPGDPLIHLHPSESSGDWTVEQFLEV